ncbi:E3 SUMO-protein ligase ZBED1-like [Scomber japonicus]|uniref:E3 SUMO-protein ligase ZBED1-like n=1 Tax=Scomber japonicus TaxID=13676 RepID=UPI002306B189|nr:E3 SUMO-protein ligase ZBED1-like [Scomber japonicus]
MDKATSILNGKFIFKALPDGGIDRTKAICIYCKSVFSFHRSTSSLKYHLAAKHTADAESPPPPSNLKQTTLGGVARRPLDVSTTRQLSTELAKWVSTSCRPISIVEDEGLRNIIRIASGDYTYALPCRTTTTTKMHDLYEGERAKVAEAVAQTSTVALTGDYWTSLGNHSYLGVTAHYFDSKWVLKSHVLTVMKTEERHLANTVAEHFMKVAQEWDIENKVSTLTTDSARNMIAASRELPFEHMPCAAHLLQRAITVTLNNSPFDGVLAKCRKVVGHFKHSPPNAAGLEQQQVAHGLPKDALTQDVSTRWNSTLEMVRSVLKNKEPLKNTLALHTTKVTMPTPAEMDKLQKLEAVLEPCRYITELLGGEKYVSSSVVLPALSHLYNAMQVSEDDPAYLAKFKEALMNDLDQRKDKTNMEWLKVATALDPRFKDLKSLNKADRAGVWRSITALLRGISPAQPEQPTTSEPPKKRLALMFAESSTDDEEDTIETCLARYRAEPTIDLEACPLEWWSNHEGAHSLMARLARKYLATPATSVPCERLFSLSGHIVQKKRASLLAENVNRLVCLSDWLSPESPKKT